MSFFKYFSKFDIFGSEVNLNFQKSSIFKTSFGGLLSFVFLLSLGIFFWNNIMTFLNKERVITSTSIIYNEDPLPTILDSSKFMFAVKINQENFIEKPMFNITFEVREFITFKNGTKQKIKTPLQLERCTLDHWQDLPSYGQNWTKLYYQFDFDNYLCPIKNSQFILSGRYNSASFKHWKFSVQKCSNDYSADSLWKPNCATEEEINNEFKKNSNVRFSFYINNFILDPIKSDQFVNTFIEDSLFFSIQNNSDYQTADIYLSESIVETDNSILPFKEIKEERFMTFRNNNFRGQYAKRFENQPYAEFFVLKDPYSANISRQYQKITEIISYIGGFAQIFILITAIIVNNYNQYEQRILLANKIYDFDISDNNNDDNSKDKKIEQLQTNQTLINQQHVKICTPPINKCIKDNQKQQNNDDLTSRNNLSIITHKQLQNNSQKQIKQIDQQDCDSLRFEKNHKNQNKFNSAKNLDTHQSNNSCSNQFFNKIENLNTIKFNTNKQCQSFDKEQKDKSKLTYKKLCSLTKSKSFETIKSHEKNEDNLKRNDLIILNRQEEECEINSQSLNNMYSSRPLHTKQIQFHKEIQQKDISMESIHPETPQIKEQQHEQQNDKNQYLDQNILNLNLENQQKNINQNNIINVNQQQKDRFIDYLQSEQSIMNSIKQIPSPTKQSPQSIRQTLFKVQRDQEQFLSNQFEQLLKKKTKLQMSFKFIIYKMTCGKLFSNKQNQLIDKAIDQMKMDLDVFMIIDKMKEIEKLKSLFLDKNQQILFNFTPKPILSVDKIEQNITRETMLEKINKIPHQLNTNPTPKAVSSKQQKKLNISIKAVSVVSKAVSKFKAPLYNQPQQFDNIKAYRKLYSAYNNVNQEEGESEINNKLIKLLGNEMNQIFKMSKQITVPCSSRHIQFSKMCDNKESIQSPLTYYKSFNQGILKLNTKNFRDTHYEDEYSQKNLNNFDTIRTLTAIHKNSKTTDFGYDDMTPKPYQLQTEL